MKIKFLHQYLFLILIAWMGNTSAQVSCSPGYSLIYKYTGYGKNYTVNNTGYVSAPDNALGIDDAKFTTLKHNADTTKLGQVTIDLTDNVPNLDTIYFLASGTDTKGATWNVSVSSDGTTFSAVQSYNSNLSTFSTYTYVVNNASGARYVRFTSSSATKDTRVDAVYYHKKTCTPYCMSGAITYSMGYATANPTTPNASTAANPDRSLGAPDQANFAKLDATGKVLYLDLGTVVPYGSNIQLFLAADAAATIANVDVTGSKNDTTFTSIQSYTTTMVQPNFTDFYYTVTQSAGIRYLKIISTTSIKADIDAVSYQFPNYWGSNYIEGYVYADANTNNIKDGAETGVSGITVTIAKDINNNGSYGPGDDVIQTTTTTSGGYYVFQRAVLDTNYLISVTTTTLPAGKVLEGTNAETAHFSTFNNTDCANNFGYAACAGNCPPVAADDYDLSYLGTANYLNVLSNDYDPNNNINTASLAVITQPKKGEVLVSNGVLIYTPVAVGNDTLTYRIGDLTSLWDTAQVVITVLSVVTDPCTEASKSHIFYIPAPEKDLKTAFSIADCHTLGTPTDTFRTIISLKCPYPGVVIFYDQWEDGYESNILDPQQTTTEVWGDGDIYNGVAPGYPTDIIPGGGSIILDNIFRANPRNTAQIYYDAKDKIFSTEDIAVSRISWNVSVRKEKQAYSTDVYDTQKFGTSFNIPIGSYTGSNYDFQYTALFVRAATNNTTVSIDKDNNGVVDTTVTLQEGDSYFQNGGVKAGAAVTSSSPVGVDVFFGDSVYCWNAKELNVLPASFYGDTYYTPVPTSQTAGNYDSSVVMFYNPFSQAITINATTSLGSAGSFVIPARGIFRYPLGIRGYKFKSSGGEVFVANELIDSWTFDGVYNGGDYDWSFALIPEARLTDFGSIAWAPGSSDLSINTAPVWVMPIAATTIYVKWDGNVNSTTGSTSPCGFKYDVSYTLGALVLQRLLDAADKDQSGLAVYDCNGVKLSMAYGEDPALASGIGFPNLDVGTSIQPFCLSKQILANDDYTVTQTDMPVTIPILANDTGFTAILDRTTVTTTGFLQPSHGTVSVNANGTLLYTPSTGYIGYDTLVYQVCSTPSPVCDYATVIIKVSSCPAYPLKNLIAGTVFLDDSKDGLLNNGEGGYTPAKVYLYTDGNCNATIDANELTDSVTVDASGTYQFIYYPQKTVADDFNDATGANRTCANGSDGNSAWASDWVDGGDVLSVGFCNNGATVANTDVEFIKDGAISYALRLKDKNRSATRTVDLSGTSAAYLSFTYRRKSTTFIATDTVKVQASSNGTTFTNILLITGNAAIDASYINVYNLNVLPYSSATTYIRFITGNSSTDADTVYIDNVSVKYLKYTQCYIVKLDSANAVPVNYVTTTPYKQNFTLTSAGTCVTRFNIGIASKSLQISGTLYNDNNGLADALVNGTAFDNPSGATMYAYLINSSGKVAAKDTFDSGNGTYKFTKASILTTYTVLISTANVAVGANAPSVSLPSKWGSVGENYGVNNTAGSGNEAGTPNSSITVTMGSVSNVTGVNFGIQKPDAGADKSACYGYGTNTVTMAATTTPGTWIPRYDNPGTATITSSTSATTTITNFTDGGTYNFIWTNGDVSDTASVIISMPDAGKDFPFCGGSGAALTGNYTTGVWTAQAGNPAGSSLSSTVAGNATATYTNAATGLFKYIFTVNGCADTAQLSLSPKPNAGSASNTIAGCMSVKGYIGQLTATNPSPNSGAWSIVSGPGIISTPSSYLSGIDSLSRTGVSTTIKWVVIDALSCRDSVTTVLAPPAIDSAYVSKYSTQYCLTCPAQNGNTFSYYDLNGKLLARVTDSADAVAIGSTTFCGQLPYAVAGNPVAADVRSVASYIRDVGNVPQPYLPRAWNINTTNDAPMTIKLYFTDEELAALTSKTTQNGGYFDFGGNASRLLLVAYPNKSDTFIPPATPNGVVYRPTFARVGSYWEATFNTNKSATFYLYPTYWANGYALPVELIDFSATAVQDENLIRLDWSTASEINNSKFEIERSYDSKNFSKIAEQKGAGNSSGTKSYVLDDKEVVAGQIYYYRLKQVDNNGHFTYSKIVSAILSAKNDFSVSEFMPNPTYNLSVVKVMSPQQVDMSVKIFTVDGSLVKEDFYPLNKGETEITLEMNNLAKGLYLVQFNYKDMMEMRKLMKLP